MLGRFTINLVLRGSLVIITVATVGSFLSASAWWLDIAVDLRLQYALGATVMMLAALVLNRRKDALAALVLLIVNGATVVPHLATAGPGPTNTKLVSFNYDWRNTAPGTVIRYLRDENADLVILLEVTSELRKSLASLSDIYPHRFHGTNVRCSGGAPHSLALLSKRPWQETGTRRLSSSSRIFYIWARFSSDSNDITVTGVHLSKPFAACAGDQQGEIDILAPAVIELGGNVVLAGDFNMTPFSTRFRNLLLRTDLRRAAGGLNASWPAMLWPVGIPIDHVLVGPDIRHAVMRVGPNLGSDHLPVVSTIDAVIAPNPNHQQD